VPQVARSLWLPRQVVQRLADAAADLGYVRFVDNPAHRRSRLAALTTHTRELAQRRGDDHGPRPVDRRRQTFVQRPGPRYGPGRRSHQ
jgi:hypothetical protein